VEAVLKATSEGQPVSKYSRRLTCMRKAYSVACAYIASSHSASVVNRCRSVRKRSVTHSNTSSLIIQTNGGWSLASPA